jgi:hypothetical protein
LQVRADRVGFLLNGRVAGAEERLDRRGEDREILSEGLAGRVAGQVGRVQDLQLLLEIALLQVRQHAGQAAPAPLVLLIVPVPAALILRVVGEAAFDVVEVVCGQADLPQVVGALHSPGSFAGRLHRGEQQGDQHADDRNDHQQFHERKAAPKR